MLFFTRCAGVASSTARFFLLSLVAGALTACGGWWDDEPESEASVAVERAPPAPNPITLSPTDLGELELELSGLGTRAISSTVRWNDDEPRRHALSAAPHTSPQAITLLNGGLDIQLQSTSTVDVGTRGSGGVRFISATYRVRNAQFCGASGSCTPYTVSRSNITFIPVIGSSTIANTAFTRFTRQDDQPASTSLAAQLMPTHGMNSIATSVEAIRASLQLFRESELPTPDLLAYGFVVNNANDGSRTLTANPPTGQFDGLVTFAYKIPLQTNAAEDPFKISIRLRVFEDNATRVTQSLEESDTSVVQRATSLGATEIAVPCNRVTTIAQAVPVCGARVAGLLSSPVTTLDGLPATSATGSPPPGAFRWSQAATWGGNKPVAGAAVVVPAGVTILLDESTPDLGSLTVEGSLIFANPVSAELRARHIIVRSGGLLSAGSADVPFLGRATITLTDTNTTADPTGMAMGTRGILVMGGGKLELFGLAPTVPWTRLNAHAEAGATQLQLAAQTNWAAGDRVAIAPTEWYPLDSWASQSQHDASVTSDLRTLSSTSGTTVRLTTGVSAFRWGLLQYMTDAGLSLTPGTFTKSHPDAASVLDERAEVGNLSRNIVIQGADDTAWTQEGFGGQVMVMDRSSSLQFNGVELRRMGQAGRVGRYPIHWHLLSYNAAGQELGDATGHFVRNSVVWNSRQRCMVIHGTNGVELRNNICYDIRGHAIFLEDAVERRNVIEGNLVMRVRSPVDSLVVANHERRDGGGCFGAASAYWLTNPDNTVSHNAAADAQGHGFWLSYPRRPVKQNALVPIRPDNLPHGVFEANSARANGIYGASLECVMSDDAGNTELNKYSPTTTGAAYDYNNGQRFTLQGLTLAKNRVGGYLNRTTLPDYRQLVLAGNRQRSVTGAVDAGTFKHSLVIARSLNDRQPYPTDIDPQLGIASYHSQMDIAENTFVGFSNRGYLLTSNGNDLSSGTFGTDDYYIRAVEKGFSRNPNNRLINSDPGYRALPPHLQSNYTPASNNNWTLAGAIWDPQGYFGPAGSYWVLDSPFLRDASCTAQLSRVPTGIANGLICAGPYYGIDGFWLNRGLPGETGQYDTMERLEVTRLNSADQEVGRWFIEQGYTSTQLGHMRHFAALRGDSYVVRFPQFPYASPTKVAPRWVQLGVENLLNANDSVLIGVHYSGTTSPGRVLVSTNPDYPNLSGPNQNSRLLTPAASRDAVAAGAGGLYWQDTANQLVWVKLVPLGLTAPWAYDAAGSDAVLYKRYNLRIEP